jgi:proteasome beta subunit
MLDRTTERLERRTTFDLEANSDPVAGEALKTGTTTVAVTAGDAVVVAADQRASLGGRFVANKDVRKVQSVADTAALAMSGTVGPVQDLVRTLEAEASLYEARRGEPLSASGLASVAGNLVRGIPAQLLLGGVDADGAHVFELDGGGGVVPATYGAAGSGMQVAYGVLEGRAEAVADPERGRELALSAVAAASQRDTASGNGAHVATVTSDGVDVDALSLDEVAAASPGATADVAGGDGA